MTLCCAQSFSQTATVIERLPDGGYIVEVDGVRHRALTAAQVREVQERKLALEKATADNALLTEQTVKLRQAFDLQTKVAELADARSEIWKQKAERWQLMYESENALRLQGEKLIGRGAVKSFLDSPYVLIGERLLDLGIKAFIASRQR